jgi:hypothetical protein
VVFDSSEDRITCGRLPLHLGVFLIWILDAVPRGVLCTLLALAIGLDSFVVGVRAGAEVRASPCLAFTLYVIMVKSISVKRKKAGRPATGTEPLYGVRIADPLMKQIMDWAKTQGATRSEAIRRLVELGLKAKK